MNIQKNNFSIGYFNSIVNDENERSTLIQHMIKSKKLKNKTFKKYIQIIILFLSYIIINNIAGKIEYKDEEDDDNYKPDNKSIYFEENFTSIREAYNNAKDFINNNINGVLLYPEKVELSQKPIVSVVIPCYDCSKYILRAIRSIQNQNLSNFEIIISNDASNNDTLMILQKLQKEENRIRIISNKINMGLLYTRSIGTLSAKGRYIFPLDSDDMILDQDVLSILTNRAYKGNFDIIIFNTICTDLKPDVYTTKNIGNYIYEGKHKPNLVMFQPDLGIHIYTPGDNIDEIRRQDFLIHGKLFKTKIYKKALNKLGIERYSRFVIAAEDELACNILFNTAKSAKFLAKYGYLYLDNDKSFSKRQEDKTLTTRTILYILDALIDFSKNEKFLVHFMIYIFKRKYIRDVLSNYYNNKVLISCLDRIFNCKFISDELKNEIRKRGENLDYIKYNFTKIF